MIRIQIKDKLSFKKKYLASVAPIIVNRLQSVIKTLEYFQGKDPEIQTGEINTIKICSKFYIKQILGNNGGYSLKDFTLKKFNNTIKDFYNKHKFNLDAFREAELFFKYLLKNDHKYLKKLLICEPNQLLSTSQKYLTKFPNLKINPYLIKGGLSYELYSDVSDSIRSFFKNQNIIAYCPYCNIREVDVIEINKKLVQGHELDHFFDKATHPMLSNSLFNLIPSDSVCNKTNKGTIQFTDDFHLNPYIDEFGKSFTFKYERDEQSAYKLKILIDDDVKDKTLQNKIYGNTNSQILEEEDKGNANVFKLKSKYARKTKHAHKVIYSVSSYNRRHFLSISHHLKALGGVNFGDSYKKWYESTFGTYFNNEDFHKERHSKFYRDIHDHYYDLRYSGIKRFLHDMNLYM